MIFLLLEILSYCAFAQDLPAKCNYNATRDEFKGGDFPDKFRWSVATASYQIEGKLYDK